MAEDHKEWKFRLKTKIDPNALLSSTSEKAIERVVGMIRAKETDLNQRHAVNNALQIVISLIEESDGNFRKYQKAPSFDKEILEYSKRSGTKINELVIQGLKIAQEVYQEEHQFRR